MSGKPDFERAVANAPTNSDFGFPKAKGLIVPTRRRKKFWHLEK